MRFMYSPRFGFCLGLLMTFAVSGASVQAQERSAAATPEAEVTITIPAEEQPFWDSAQEFVDAYAKRDAAAIGNMFTEDAEFLDEFGELTEGREAITALFASVFEANEGASIDEIQITRVRYLSDTIAMEEGFVISSEAPG